MRYIQRTSSIRYATKISQKSPVTLHQSSIFHNGGNSFTLSPRTFHLHFEESMCGWKALSSSHRKNARLTLERKPISNAKPKRGNSYHRSSIVRKNQPHFRLLDNSSSRHRLLYISLCLAFPLKFLQLCELLQLIRRMRNRFEAKNRGNSKDVFR